MRESALQAFLRDLQDPSAAAYHHYLTPEAFGARFGLSRVDEGRVESLLRDAGLHVTASYPQRTSLSVQGRAVAVGALFGTVLKEYRDVSGRTFHAPSPDPSIPNALLGLVTGVTGLSNRAVAQPQDIPTNGMTPQDLEKAYDIAPLHTMGIDGKGQTIAVYSEGSFTSADADGFARSFGVNSPQPTHVSVDGGTTDTTGGAAGEDALDLDTIRGVAPQAKVINYEVPSGNFASFATGLADVVNRVVQDGQANILSISYGVCDVATVAGQSFLPTPERLAAERAFQAAAAAGLSIFVASTDGGAYACQHFIPQDIAVTAGWPGDSPSVISVGGTFLNVRSDGTYLTEAGWANPITRWGGGGGLNPIEARPSWQVGPGVQNSFSNGKRQFPDISGDADGATGYQVYFGGSLSRIGGTSGSCPFWAGITALTAELAQRSGVSKLGFIAPMLYQLAATPQSFPPYHDVTRGSNLFYPATAGWDYATGLGTPDVFNFARDMVALLKK
jgi:kumamolisin